MLFVALKKSAIKTDIKQAVDRDESVSAMEPLLVAEGSSSRASLNDLTIDLAAASAGLRRSLPPDVVKALADLVRGMNCYYSNLIEGHDTHPVDIERALKNDYSKNPQKRDLQLEAKAHVSVQQWIDSGGLVSNAMSAEALCEIHRRFGELLPPELLKIRNTDTPETLIVVPGELRHVDVKIGRHVPISPGAIARFLSRFSSRYGGLGKSETILAAAAAHHRLLWIHPFLDGNGRVARLMTHAVLLKALETGGIWSVARGLARNESRYKSHLADCDLPRRGDRDGRGALSEEALVEFTRFFLETCLDQVRFMESLVQPDRLRGRILAWAEEEVRAGNLPIQAGRILEAVLFRGELRRAEVPGIVGAQERHSRRVLSTLLEQGVLVSESSRAPLRLYFPARLASHWMPGLFPSSTG